MSACASQATEKLVKPVYGGVRQLPRCGRNRETYIRDKKTRERIPHIGPIPVVIPPKLFLKDIFFSADNFTRVLRGSFVFFFLHPRHFVWW